MNALRLTEALLSAGVEIDGVSIGAEGVSSSVTIMPPQLQGAAQAIIDAFDWSIGAHTAWTVLSNRVALLATLVGGDLSAQRTLALLLIILDEFNSHALKINAILAAVDGAASLAALKTAVAAIADYPPRTKAQLVTALANKINTGDVDA